MAEHNSHALMGITMEKIKEMVSTDQVIGQPITMPDGITILPVCKVSYGFASGGSDLPTKSQKQVFGGGGGAGITMEPVAFLVVKEGNVRLMQISSSSNTVDKVVDAVPDVIDKVSGFVAKAKEKKAADTPEE
ncbi:MAG: GerW family sporulation protein [Oscillospiraceae bacterium]|nr:GerW family sporulation protein [Oscillospiraceae bacterium]